MKTYCFSDAPSRSNFPQLQVTGVEADGFSQVNISLRKKMKMKHKKNITYNQIQSVPIMFLLLGKTKIPLQLIF